MSRTLEFSNDEGVFTVTERESHPFIVLTDSDITDDSLHLLRTMPPIYRAFIMFGEMASVSGRAHEYRGCINIQSAQATLRYHTQRERWAYFVISHIANIHAKFEHSVTT